MLQLRSAIAFRSAPTFRVDARDFVRVVQHGDVTLAMLADGHEGFGSGCPAAARLMLDTAEGLWPEMSGDLRTRLMEVFRIAEERMLAFEGSDEDGPAFASLMVVASHGATVCAAWICGDVALHARGNGITKTRPHTLLEMYRDMQRELPSALTSSAKHIYSRAIGVRYPGSTKPVPLRRARR